MPMFAGIAKKDIEIYAGADNIIRIKLKDEQGESLRFVDCQFEAGIKLRTGAKLPDAVFEVTSDDGIELRMSAVESTKLIDKTGKHDVNAYYDVMMITNNGERWCIVYGDARIKRGVMIHA